uniref:Uncharacterized protein n=1 Tax=Parascaris univalens TaxID=6257 RepID=A0A915AZR0_PARUN
NMGTPIISFLATLALLIASLSACGRLPLKPSVENQRQAFAFPSIPSLFQFLPSPAPDRKSRTEAVKEIFGMSNITDVIGETEFSNETADAGKRTELLTPQNWNRSHQYSCFSDQKCKWHSQCGTGGCIYGKCRCSCIESTPCFMNEHCFGYPCTDICASITGFATDCNREDQCARGTQCLVGVCVGGGRFNAGFYEGVSCSVFTEKVDCSGIAKEKCAIIGDLCIRHYNASHIGQERSRNICNNGVSSSVGFPTCVSAKGRPILCGILDMCRVGSHCGSCECDYDDR